MKRQFFAAMAISLALGCAPKEVNYAVKIITQSCQTTSDPFGAAQFIKVRVFALDIPQGIEVISAKDPGTREIKIPEIPAGTGRVIEVRAYDGDPNSDGKLLSMGRSKSFDVPDVVPDELAGKSIEIGVYLRKLNSFSAPVDLADQTKCQRMTIARAGHTATLLKNGKVYLAGGYNMKPQTQEKLALVAAEIYDPATGTFTAVHDLSLNGQPSARAFHTATRVPSGQVMLWGGESYANSASSTIVSARGIVLFYDPDEDDVGAVPNAKNRTRHSMAVDKDGRVFIVGGVTGTGEPVPQIEWIDTTTNVLKVLDAVTLPMVGGNAVAIKAGELISVTGGTDGTMFSNDIRSFKFSTSAKTFVELSVSPKPQLPLGRRNATGVSIREGVDMMLLGGFSESSLFRPLKDSVIVSSAGVSAGQPLLVERGDVCSVLLKDGSILTVGGRTAVDGTGTGSKSDATVELFKANNSGAIVPIGAPALSVPRYFHTCTALDDGTALVTGGVNESPNGSIEILQDAWIYQPTPAVQ